MKPIKGDMSEDEDAASPAASEENEELEDEEEGEEEGEEGEEGEEDEEDEEGEEQQEEKDMQVEENSASEDSVDENKSPDRHPYPTPPPDDESKMAPLDLLVKSKTTIKSMSTKNKAPLINLALMAIENLKERSGSSVQAIMKYLKENGHPWTDMKRQARNMNKALKMGVENGQLVMVKRSFKLTEASKKASLAVEKMKAKQQKEKLKKAKAADKEKEKQKEKAAKKAEKNAKKAATKKEKPGKTSERKTKQATKKKKTEDGTKDVPPKAKTAASVAARALLDTPTDDKEPAKETGKKARAKAKTNSSEAGKPKKPRKSIGTLAQTKTSKPNAKAVKKLVAAKAITMPDDEDIGELSEAQASSTPQMKSQGKRKRKL